MKKRVFAGFLAVVFCVGATAALQTRALADTAIIEEDMEDDVEPEGMEWSLKQTVSAASCRQGKDVTLSVALAGDAQKMQLSTVYATLTYDPEVFQLDADDVTPVQAGLADYISFDRTLGEVDIYYANDISVESGSELFKIRFHVRAGADTGATRLGVETLELYATDSDDYAVIENKNKLSVSIKKSSPAALPGDVNQDKKISLTDVKLIMRYCNHEVKLNAAQKKNADVNRDGKVDLKDASLVMKYCNGEIKKF